MLDDAVATVPVVWMFMLQVCANLPLQAVPQSAKL